MLTVSILGSKTITTRDRTSAQSHTASPSRSRATSGCAAAKTRMTAYLGVRGAQLHIDEQCRGPWRTCHHSRVRGECAVSCFAICGADGHCLRQLRSLYSHCHLAHCRQSAAPPRSNIRCERQGLACHTRKPPSGATVTRTRRKHSQCRHQMARCRQGPGVLGPWPLVSGAHGMERTAAGRDGFSFRFGSRMLDSDRGMSLGADLHGECISHLFADRRADDHSQ